MNVRQRVTWRKSTLIVVLALAAPLTTHAQGPREVYENDSITSQIRH